MTVFRAAAVQMPFAWAATPQEYFEQVRLLVAEAAAEEVQLAVFPAHMGDMLVGIQVPVPPGASREQVCASGGFASWNACVQVSGAPRVCGGASSTTRANRSFILVNIKIVWIK